LQSTNYYFVQIIFVLFVYLDKHKLFSFLLDMTEVTIVNPSVRGVTSSSHSHMHTHLPSPPRAVIRISGDFDDICFKAKQMLIVAELYQQLSWRDEYQWNSVWNQKKKGTNSAFLKIQVTPCKGNRPKDRWSMKVLIF